MNYYPSFFIFMIFCISNFRVSIGRQGLVVNICDTVKDSIAIKDLEIIRHCIPDPPCQYCLEITDTEPLFHAVHIIKHRGSTWYQQSVVIIEKNVPKETFSHFLYNMLKDTTKLLPDGSYEFGSTEENIHYVLKHVMRLNTTCQLPDEVLLVYLRLGMTMDEISDTSAFLNSISSFKEILLVGVIVGANAERSESYKGNKLILENYLFIVRLAQLIKSRYPTMIVEIYSAINFDNIFCLLVFSKYVYFVEEMGPQALLEHIRKHHDLSIPFIKSIDTNLLKENATKASNECSALQRTGTDKIPNMWVQQGSARSATTLQYRILTMIGLAICGGNGIVTNFISSDYAMAKYSDLANKNPNKLYIIKAHIESALNYTTRGAYIFITTINERGERYDEKVDRLRLRQIPVKFVQEYDEVLRVGPLIVKKYLELFKLPAKTVSLLIDIIEGWDLMRLCW